MIDRRDREFALLQKDLSAIDLTEVAEDIRCLSTGVVAFDLAMGGGWPESRFSEIMGDWQSGKSLVMYQSIRECQKAGGLAVLDDAERAFDVRWARALGIDVSQLIVYISESLEDGFKHLEKVCRRVRELESFKNIPVLYVKDSLEASIAHEEIDMDFIKPTVAVRARTISKGLRRLTNLIADQRVAVVFVNQLRQKIGVMFGVQEESGGGRAPKFYAGMRVILRKKGKIKEEGGERVIGVKGSFEVIKSKIGVPFRHAPFELMFGSGIDPMSGLFEYLLTEGVIQKVSARKYGFEDKEFMRTTFLPVWEECKDKMLEALNGLPGILPHREQDADLVIEKEEE